MQPLLVGWIGYILVVAAPLACRSSGAEEVEVPAQVERKAMEDSCEVEIVELHRFFEDWFTGRIPNTDEAFARFAGVMADGFEIVPPSGTRTAREPLLAGLRQAHGTWPSSWTIEVRKISSHPAEDGTLVATYEEWQTQDGPRGRRSVAVMRPRSGTPNGLEWLHVEESWLPGSGD